MEERTEREDSETGPMTNALRPEQDDVMAPFLAVVSEYPFVLCVLNNAGGQMALV